MGYTARDHAFVYGVIAQTALEKYPDCEPALIEGIKIYGRQRGARMGMLAESYGDDRSMQHYMAYGEWAPAPGEMDIAMPELVPSAVWNVKKCPWCQEWTEKGMLDVGKLYCRYVDQALVAGFNPELELGIGTTQTGGDEFCYFKWNGAEMTPEHQQENAEIQAKIADTRIRPWSYHMAHIYKTLGEALEEALGADARADIYEAVDKRLEDAYDSELVDLMHAGLIIDYWVTPGRKNTDLLVKLF